MMYGGNSRYLPVAGRVLLGLIFLLTGIFKLMDPQAVTGYIASVGLPMPVVLFWLSTLAELVGGAMIVAGFHARIAAWGLIVFTLLASIIFHRDLGDQAQMTAFLKNLAIVGGLLYVAKFGSGMWSIRSGNCACCDDHSCKTCDAPGEHGRTA